MMKEVPNFFVQEVQIANVPGREEGSRLYEGRVVVQDSNQTVDAYGTLRQVYRENVAEDPFQAVHGAIQDAARDVDPMFPQADLIATNAVQTLPLGEFRGEAHFKIGKRVIPSVAFHPTNEQAARMNAVIKGNEQLHLYRE